MTSKTENFYKTEKVAWDVSKPGYLSESGNVTLNGDTVINVELLRDTDWIWTNIPSEIGAQHLKFADGYKPNIATEFSTPLSVRNHKHKISAINFSNVWGRTAPILFTEGLTKLEVYSDFLETFYLRTNVSRDPEDVSDWHAGYLEQIILSHTPNLTTFSVNNAGRLRELYADDFSHVTSMVEAFYGNTSLEYISPMYLDSCMDLNSMFAYCNFSEFPTTLHNTSNVKSTDSMFYKCRNLISVPLFDTQNVTNMYHMFYNCTNLTTVPLFDTQNVTIMDGMFYWCTNLTSVPLFNTQNVTNMDGMLKGCTNLTSVPLFNTQNVTNMDGIFANCKSLTTVPLFDTQNVTNMQDMFWRCNSLTSVPLYDTQNVTNMYHMFYECTNLTSVPLLDFTKVTDAREAFYGCTSLTDVGGFTGLKVDISFSDSPLTHDSALNIINNLAVSPTGEPSHTITFSKVTYNTLSEADIKIATDKRWTIVSA